MAMPAACFYHGPTARPCVSLRDFLGRPAALVVRRSSSRMGTAMLDRSAELRAAGNGEAPGPAAALEALQPLTAGLDQQQLTEAQREQATHDILRAFLAASINRSSNSSSSNSWFGGGGSAGAAPHRQRGLQGQVVEHLIAGGFDEALLQSVPTHTLNWAIKVGCCSS